MADTKTQVVITAKDETAAGFASAEAALQRLTGQFISLTNPVAAASVAMTAAAGALALSVKSAIDTGDQFNKLSQKTGIAVESLSALAYAGELSDVSIESLATGIKKLSVNMNEAASATNGKAAEAFRALGVVVKGNDGILRASDAVLGDIADRFANMKDGAGKTALAVALFGKAGADLIPLLNQGGKGIAALREEAEKLGLVMTSQTAKAAEEFNDNIKKLTLSTSALGKSITADLIGPLAEYTRLMVEARKNGVGVFGSLAVGLRAGGAEGQTLDELRERASTLQGRISDATRPGGFNIKSRVSADKAELAILQQIIAARLKAAEDFGPPALPGEKKDAPIFGEKDSINKETPLSRALKEQQKRLAALNATAGDEQMVSADTVSRQYAAKEAEDLEKLRDKYAALADPLQKYREQLDDIEKLKQLGREAGGLDAAQALEAAMRVNDAMDSEIAKLNEVRDAGKDAFSDLANAVESWGNKAADTFADFVVDGKASFGDLVNSMLKDIVRLQAKQLLDPITKGASSFLSGAIGNLFGGGSGGGSSAWDFGPAMPDKSGFSWAGGGYTGDGSRSGGLDGQGGFLAMLHPQESVIDHARGNSGGGGAVTVVLNISTGVAQTVRSEIMNLMPQIQAATQGAVMDARLRGGSARAAFRG